MVTTRLHVITVPFNYTSIFKIKLFLGLAVVLSPIVTAYLINLDDRNVQFLT